MKYPGAHPVSFTGSDPRSAREMVNAPSWSVVTARSVVWTRTTAPSTGPREFAHDTRGLVDDRARWIAHCTGRRQRNRFWYLRHRRHRRAAGNQDQTYQARAQGFDVRPHHPSLTPGSPTGPPALGTHPASRVEIRHRPAEPQMKGSPAASGRIGRDDLLSPQAVCTRRPTEGAFCRFQAISHRLGSTPSSLRPPNHDASEHQQG